MVQSVASDYFVVDEHAVDDVTATLPVALPSPRSALHDRCRLSVVQTG